MANSKKTTLYIKSIVYITAPNWGCESLIIDSERYIISEHVFVKIDDYISSLRNNYGDKYDFKISYTNWYKPNTNNQTLTVNARYNYSNLVVSKRYYKRDFSITNFSGSKQWALNQITFKQKSK